MNKIKSDAPESRNPVSIYFKRYWQLYLLLALPMLYLLIFKYIPMVYIQIAFKKYMLNTSVWSMPLAKNNGFQYFIQAFSNPEFLRALRNTIVLNLLDLCIGFPIPIIFALILNELVFKRFKKVVQTIAYMPHFLSWVIIYGIAIQLFAPSTGLINLAITKMGGEAVPFLNDGNHWVWTYIFLGVWQSFGWNSIVYLAAIAGINSELYEAASVDGAGRFKKMWHITLPGIKPTIVILLIMAIGTILLMMPFATKSGESIGFFDSLFTTVSATCVTGLIVRDTATTFNTFGQVVLMLLIQVGGLGLVTIYSFAVNLFRRKISVKMAQRIPDVAIITLINRVCFIINTNVSGMKPTTSTAIMRIVIRRILTGGFLKNDDCDILIIIYPY